MADELPTADRDARYCTRLGQECTYCCPECNEDVASRVEIRRRINDPGSFVERSAGESVGNWQTRALLPHINVLLDRARQQGRAEAVDAIEAARDDFHRRHPKPASDEWVFINAMTGAAFLARGSQTAPSATENAETGGGA